LGKKNQIALQRFSIHSKRINLWSTLLVPENAPENRLNNASMNLLNVVFVDRTDSIKLK
jgi:hypothetical protein